jgi:secondary thiamine-phosphate synthase enzyme
LSVKDGIIIKGDNMVITNYIQLQTSGNTDILDITGEVGESIRGCSINDGTVTIFCPSSTSSVTTIEFESGCLKDLKRLFDEILNPTRDYAHNSRWGDGNGHSHIRASLLGPSLTIPIVDGQLSLGTWQQIIFIDFDVRPRSRRIIIQMVGE